MISNIESAYNWRTLICDDHAILRFSLKSIVESEGLCRVVAEASTGNEAVTLALAIGGLDLVLLDLSMPGETDGIAAARSIAAARPEVKILALTAYQDSTSILGVFSAGAHGFVHKSGDESQLRNAIRATMRGEQVMPPGASATLLRQAASPGSLGGFRFAPRELEVLRHTATGASVKETAVALGIEEVTVRGYRKSAARKIGRSGAGALTKFFLENSRPRS